MMRVDARRSVVAVVASVLLVRCTDEAPPRPQLLIVLDTTAPVVGQLAGDPALSSDAAVDTVRIDIIDDAGQPYDFRDFVAPDVRDWPISFGVASDDFEGHHLRLRIRAFRGAWVSPGSLRDVTTVEPHPEVTIDRLVQLTLPEDGVKIVQVVLDADCVGTSVKFTAPQSTCVSGAMTAAAPDQGVSELAQVPPTSRAGTWERGSETPCKGSGPEGSVCIPGGYSVLGDLGLVGVADVMTLDSVPLRPVYLDPFWLDATEVTVGRYRALVAQGRGPGEPPWFSEPANESRAFCTWLGPDVSTHDDLPLTCIKWQSAAETCEQLGGMLPTEAQWEHAARGRGQHRDFPWGESEPSCCSAALDRYWSASVPHECPGQGVSEVGSHAAPDACESVDESRDGIFDLAGSVTEHVADFFLPYDHTCWGGLGILQNPVCAQEGETNVRASRGGNWTSGLLTALSSLRRAALQSQAHGFRCAYTDAGGRP